MLSFVDSLYRQIPSLFFMASFRRDTARLWTSLTAAAVGADAVAALPATVPDHAYFPLYGPDFRMATREKTLPDNNDDIFIGR